MFPTVEKLRLWAVKFSERLTELFIVFYNDGDRFWEDYGVETCGSSAYYLTTVGGSLAQWVTDNTGEEYEKREIENLVKAAVITLEKFPQLFEEKNYDDSTAGYKKKAEELFVPYNDFGEDDEDY